MNAASTSRPRLGALFLNYLDNWHDNLAPQTLEQVLSEAGSPGRVGIFCVDMINGFCHEGRLQSDRIKGIIPAVLSLMQRAHAAGVQHFVLTQDNHPPDALEFTDFPIHCVRGTPEAETIPEIAALPFASLFTIVPKLSINSAIETTLDKWLSDHPEVTHRIVIGDCTDLCTYQLAMHLKLTANARNDPFPVIVPADCVETYDFPVDLARDLGVPAHPGDLFHRFFLFHMALNGVKVVKTLA